MGPAQGDRSTKEQALVKRRRENGTENDNYQICCINRYKKEILILF